MRLAFTNAGQSTSKTHPLGGLFFIKLMGFVDLKMKNLATILIVY